MLCPRLALPLASLNMITAKARTKAKPIATSDANGEKKARIRVIADANFTSPIPNHSK